MVSSIERQDGVQVFGNHEDLEVRRSPKNNFFQKVTRFFGFSKANVAESRLGLSSSESPLTKCKITYNPLYDPDDDSAVERKSTLSFQNTQSSDFSGTMKSIQHLDKNTSVEEDASGSMVVASKKLKASSEDPDFIKHYDAGRWKECLKAKDDCNAGLWDKYLKAEDDRIAQTEGLYDVLPCDQDDSGEVIIENLPKHITSSVRFLKEDFSEVETSLVTSDHVQRLVNLYSAK